ncbi:MAG: amino acid--tRNA ligase-related protein, partial [Desulfobacterales bacterium]
MTQTSVNALLSAQHPLDPVDVRGWVRTRRDAKAFSFHEINDGSCLKNIQVIADEHLENFDAIKSFPPDPLLLSPAPCAPPLEKNRHGKFMRRKSTFSRQRRRLSAAEKRHTDEFLRTISHLRPRTNKYGAAFRIRSRLSFAVHQFFQERGFFYIHTPILTGSDCEGAGELFQVTSLTLDDLPKKDGKVDYTADFFGKPANLTVSGQLEAEAAALALGNVYTFGPTFRAENSNTRRHAAEFWMVEPEMAFCDLRQDMAVAEAFVKFLVDCALNSCAEDLHLFAKFVDKRLMADLETILSKPFVRLPYAEAVAIL